MKIILNPLDALIPKIPFSFFTEFWVRVTPEAPGVCLGRILGVPSIEPFLREGGGPAGGLYRPPPPEVKARPPLCTGLQAYPPPPRPSRLLISSGCHAPVTESD